VKDFGIAASPTQASTVSAVATGHHASADALLLRSRFESPAPSSGKGVGRLIPMM
jgi:hypothetical protein